MADKDTSKVEIGIPGVDFAQMAREAIAGQLTAAMIGSPAAVQSIVASALTTKVDHQGHLTRGGYSSDRAYVEWIAEDLIRQSALKVLQERVAQLRPDIEKAVEKLLKQHAGSIAAALVKSYTENVGHAWNTTVNFEVSPRGR